jgi:sulfate adenylyltransferase subunit 2
MNDKLAISVLDQLESESVHIFREVAAEFDRSVMMYSVGKDSSVMLHLALKAFHPAPLPFQLLHVDTSFKFPEMYGFRDRRVAETGCRLLVYSNRTALSAGTNPWDMGTVRCCSLLKTQGLLEALKAGQYQAVIGGARREEERSRAKERIYSFRDRHGQWDPRRQRPEMWQLYNGRIQDGESIRVFPLSNWTELDIWRYIDREKIPVAPLYFAQERQVIERNGQLIPVGKGTRLLPGETIETRLCRYRTLGCYPCTGAVPSSATTVAEIIAELVETRLSERTTRLIDHDQDASMEKKKQEGYF